MNGLRNAVLAVAACGLLLSGCSEPTPEIPSETEQVDTMLIGYAEECAARYDDGTRDNDSQTQAPEDDPCVAIADYEASLLDFEITRYYSENGEYPTGPGALRAFKNANGRSLFDGVEITTYLLNNDSSVNGQPSDMRFEMCVTYLDDAWVYYRSEDSEPSRGISGATCEDE